MYVFSRLKWGSLCSPVCVCECVVCVYVCGMCSVQMHPPVSMKIMNAVHQKCCLKKHYIVC